MTEKIEYIETHIGEFLEEEFLKPLHISANALAIALHVPSSRIYAILNGTRKISIDTDLRLSKFFGTRVGFFLGIQEDLERPDVERAIKKDLATIIPYKELEKPNKYV